MAAAAPEHGAAVTFASIAALPWPLAVAAARGSVGAASRGVDAMLLDSIAAAFAAPWVGSSRTPIVAVVHQPPGGMDGGAIRSSAQRALDRIAYRAATGFVAASESLVEDLRRIGVPAERIRFVPPGCDVPFADGPPLDLRRGRSSAVLCVANWTPRKGILELLEAFAALPDGAATLWLVGETDADRDHGRRVSGRIARPDLAGRVVATGAVPIEEVGRMYRSADVFALCSEVDPYGTAWAEAIAAGLPVVGWRTANLPRLAEHGREALMPQLGDREGLASALRSITTDAELRGRLAAAARRRASTLPTWQASTQRFYAAIRQLVGPTRGGVAR